MSTTLQANQSFGAKLLHILTLGTRDVYKTDNGQLITMKADQGRVEVDDDGEVNIFDAKNVKAKGVDGVVDEFYLHNCTGERNKGKKLNDAGDIFELVDDDDDDTETSGTSATSGTSGTSTTDAADSAEDTDSSSNDTNNSKMQDLLNELLEMIQKLLSGEDETPKTYSTGDDDDSTSASDSSDSSAIFNTTVNDNKGTVNIENNYNPKKAETTTKSSSASENKKSTSTSENKTTTDKTTQKSKTTNSIFNTTVNDNNGTVNITNNYYGDDAKTSTSTLIKDDESEYDSDEYIVSKMSYTFKTGNYRVRKKI